MLVPDSYYLKQHAGKIKSAQNIDCANEFVVWADELTVFSTEKSETLDKRRLEFSIFGEHVRF